ncbi:DUF724 domain-containing protein 5-like [Papaver somniferum]|uniref:DUF724 domain-containing protein 5-like n=1 Tax=Papaver somniferum TaxID=3469 RepID=UPI000E6F8444|nr:DUF724 domain-containing protein 5-like [Papaver somniferum]
MASIQTNSSGKLVMKFTSTPSPNPSPSAPSPNPPQSTPSPDLSMRFSLLPHRSSYLSPELKIQYEQVFFKEIPQTPHFSPLSKLNDENKEGVMLGWDISFLTFVRKLQNSADPSIFLSELKTYTDQLAEFETMGYEVSKLRERLHVLIRKANKHIMLKHAVHEAEEEEKEKTTKAKCQECRIQDLEEDLKKARKLWESQKSDIQKTNMKKRKFVEDATENVREFKKSAKSPL